jgi:hypothetical protein
MKREIIETMKPAVQVGSFVGLILFTKRVFATSAFFPDLGCEFSPLIMLYSQSGEAVGLAGCWQVLASWKFAGEGIELDETAAGRH